MVGLWDLATQTLQPIGSEDATIDETPLGGNQIGGVEAVCELKPGESKTFTFVMSWHFPNTPINGRTRWYASNFDDADAVAVEVLRDLESLTSQTRLWRDVWYAGTLPHWLLERTLLTVDALQTNTCYRFEDGQFWAWEGVGCCAGTCTHVWHYAQTVARLFPDLERDLRERTDFGLGFRESDGFIDFRGGQAKRDATDGQAGVILRTYREHEMSGNDEFLKRVWPKCKKAIEFLISQDARDGSPDGIPVGKQHNTLDADWYGKVPVLASLYLAALRAGEEMARTVGDQVAAERYRNIYEKGVKNIIQLFKEDFGYFVQEEDVNHLDAIGIGNGCYIDQVMGQWWAFNLGLGRLYDGAAIRSALNRLWDYNFCPDIGQLRESIANPSLRGRPYAIAGDAGLVMCTWPKGGRRDDWERHWQYGYFNECMTGFEYEAAGHMVWESKWDAGLLEKGLAITRAVHDRYHASLRNPFNEIECSDHYARAMASYGVFLAACGFEYDGTKGHLSFAPRLSPENFSAAFTAAEGWGTIEQKCEPEQQTQRIDVRWGQVELETLTFELENDLLPTQVAVLLNGKKLKFSSAIRCTVYAESNSRNAPSCLQASRW